MTRWRPLKSSCSPIISCVSWMRGPKGQIRDSDRLHTFPKQGALPDIGFLVRRTSGLTATKPATQFLFQARDQRRTQGTAAERRFLQLHPDDLVATGIAEHPGPFSMGPLLLPCCEV